MKKYILAFLLLLPGSVFAEFTASQIADFGGFVDVLEPDSLADKYSPDCLNVYTDQFNALTKREGYSAFFASPLPQLQQIRTLYSYSKQDGSKYIITESSSSIYCNPGGGSNTSIVSGRNPNYRYTFMTSGDYLYGSNGYDNVFKSSATGCVEFTVGNSTGMVKARYICNYYNKAFYSGVDGARSTIYWSKYLDPANINPFNYVNVNAQDGDVITGLYVTSDNKMKVFKTYSTWELYPTGVDSTGETNFDFRNLSQNVGCLYGTTVDELNGNLVFLGGRGVYLYDGSFNLISLPIDNFMKSLRQLRAGSLLLSQDTAVDWGAGSGTNIDTTTYSGSVAINSAKTSMIDTVSDRTFSAQNGYYYRQKFIPSYNCILSSLTIKIGGSYGGGVPTGSHSFYLKDVSSNTIASYSTTSITPLLTISSTSLALSGGSTYYAVVTISGVSHYSPAIQASDATYSFLSSSSEYSSDGGLNYAPQNTRIAIDLDVYYPSASYTSQSNQAASWGSWGNFSTDDTIPANSGISYYAITSTSVYNLSTNSAFPMSNGSPINSSVGPYIAVISSFTRTDIAAIPMLNSFSIVYYGTDNNVPIGKVYDGRYHLFVSTDDVTRINNVDLVYQQTGDWTKFNDIYAQGACIYRDYFYTGDSRNTGQVYKMFVKGLYNDNGGAYDAYWCSKVFDFGVFSNMKRFDSMWISAKNSGNWNLNIDYRLDGTINGWTNKTLSLYNTYGDISTKIPFSMSEPNSGRSIQYRVRNSNANEYFTFKKLQTVYEILPVE